ncbi:lipoprotein [Klebsiella grimontii]|nr:lipoprotein [Klebsiella grimontii]
MVSPIAGAVLPRAPGLIVAAWSITPYKDLVKIHIPRTANEMYHLRDARPVDRGELQSGDLVFFRTRGRGTADHVGVYVGNGKFIQSPRTGRDIQITSLSDDYWVRHYVGARRVMTPKTIR